MSTRKNLVIVLMLVIILVLTCYVVHSEMVYHRKKEVFVNNTYFLLKDFHTELNKSDAESLKSSSKLNEILIVLEQKFCSQSEEMRSSLSYPRKGVFEVIYSNIHDGVYTQDELTELAADIQMLIDQLSDETGMAENNELTDKELNDVYRPFIEKWS